MNIRINLIRENEIRQPGLMNPKMIMRMSLAALVGLIVLTIMLILLHVASVNRALSQARARHKKVDPVFQDVRALQQDLAFNQALLKDLQGWNKWRFEWQTILMDLQAAVPAPVQLTRLAIKSNMIMIHPPKWEKKALPVPARRFSVHLDGIAAGERGDEVVVQFVRSLRTARGLDTLIDSVRLATGLKKAPTRPGAEEGWMFAIEAESFPRKME
ncbi:MAG: hypothetical protein JXB04_00145 [Kiritimatiellae bacterium]|nr:hypothetical protein [Kiritimatiellia bacterium]